MSINPERCITIWGTRTRGSEFFKDMPPRGLRTIADAVERLVRFELGYGGNVVSVEEKDGIITIITVTRMMGCVDRTYFEGSAEDMRPLMEACYFFAQACERKDPIVKEVTARLTEGPTGGMPFLVANLGPLLIGGALVKTSMLLACGITEEEDVARGRQIPTEDLVSTIELWHECSGEEPFREFAEELFAA